MHNFLLIKPWTDAFIQQGVSGCCRVQLLGRWDDHLSGDHCWTILLYSSSPSSLIKSLACTENKEGFLIPIIFQTTSSLARIFVNPSCLLQQLDENVI